MERSGPDGTADNPAPGRGNMRALIDPPLEFSVGRQPRTFSLQGGRITADEFRRPPAGWICPRPISLSPVPIQCPGPSMGYIAFVHWFVVGAVCQWPARIAC